MRDAYKTGLYRSLTCREWVNFFKNNHPRPTLPFEWPVAKFYKDLNYSF